MSLNIQPSSQHRDLLFFATAYYELSFSAFLARKVSFESRFRVVSVGYFLIRAQLADNLGSACYFRSLIHKVSCAIQCISENCFDRNVGKRINKFLQHNQRQRLHGGVTNMIWLRTVRSFFFLNALLPERLVFLPPCR
ncbi:hypothetical protein GZ77_07005 [Endozoicomonas montiporae]|uniref:Uncharacterized protein n=1 Tax=Endozoicomonas montiporae TaxID=1027273 RepID=A0A081N6V9_9GAMM|nr:hypothetical protein GZ77_07005 [Endozoicomonas montiporae]